MRLKMNKRKISQYTLVSLAAALVLAVVAALAFAGGLALAPQLNVVAQASDGGGANQLTSTVPAELVLESDDVLATFEGALIDVYQRTLPSVVDVEVTQRVSVGTGNGFGGGSGDLFRQGEGSGFVWDTEGHIVTNYHVVEEAETVRVIFANGASLEAEVIGSDADADLAVLEVKLPASGLQPLVLGDSDALQVGQLTIAIGNPYGQGYSQFTIPSHLYTQKNRDSVSTGSVVRVLSTLKKGSSKPNTHTRRGIPFIRDLGVDLETKS